MDSERKGGIGVSDTDLVFGPVCVSRTKFHTFMSERTVLVTFVDSDVFVAKVCLLLP